MKPSSVPWCSDSATATNPFGPVWPSAHRAISMA
jgi:hypothetical protein